jgi:type III secretion protein J
MNAYESRECIMQMNKNVFLKHSGCRLFFSLLFLFFASLLLTGCESRKTIVNALDEKEANEIIVYLAGKGIDASKVQEPTAGGGGAKIILYDIEVPADTAIEAMTVLNQAGLPRRRGQNLLGIFSGSGLVPSDLEQRIRYESGLAEQIASSIRKIDGIIDADVQVSFPQEDPLNPGQYKGKITASVFAKHNGILDDANSHLVSKIKRLVASSITGLNYDDVTVIPVRAQMNEAPGGLIGGGTEEEKQYVTVWTLTLAQDSVTRFRIIFFSFSGTILILLLILVWISWKIHPLLAEHGGIKELFHVHPIKAKPKEEVKEEGGDDKQPPKTDESGENEKGVDIT